MQEVSNVRYTASYKLYTAMDHHHIHVLNWQQQIQKTEVKGTKTKTKQKKHPSNQKMRPLQFTSFNLGPLRSSPSHRANSSQWAQTSRKFINRESTENFPKLLRMRIAIVSSQVKGERFWMGSILRRRVGRVIVMDIAYNFNNLQPFEGKVRYLCGLIMDTFNFTHNLSFAVGWGHKFVKSR